MKRIIITCIVTGLLFVVMCGCKNNNSNNSERAKFDNNSSSEVVEDMGVIQNNNPIALTITASNDYNKLANSMQQLYNDSDIVCEIKVKEVHPYIDQNGRIISEVTPQIIATYKGNYNNEKISIIGGRMLYSEYMSNEFVKHKFEGKMDSNSTSDQFLNQDVLYVVDNGYVYAVGDEYIFFGKLNKDTGKYIQTYGYQGSFKIESNTLNNKALKEDEELYKDISKQFSQNSKKLASSKIDKNSFISSIKKQNKN